MKGLFGNLSVMPLYELFSRQTSLLRSGAFQTAEAMLPEIKRAMDTLEEALALAKQAESGK